MILRPLVIGCLLTTAAGAQPTPVTWTLVRDVRFGSETDPVAGLSGRPRTIALGPDDHVFIYELSERVIKEYDRSGAYLGRIGGRGRGPGELLHLQGMGFLGDTLWISDGDLRRVTLFTPERRQPITIPLFYNPPGAPQRFQARGGYIPHVVGSAPTAMVLGGGAVAQGTVLRRSGSPTPMPIALIRRDGTVAASLASPVHDLSPQIILRPAGGPYHIIPQPFEEAPVWAPFPNGKGIAVVDAPTASSSRAAFTVQVFDSAGRSVRVRRYQYDPVPVTNRLRDSVIRALAGRAGGGADLERSLRDSIRVPPFLPPITGIRAGRDGSIWLQRERLATVATVWNVIDAGGNLVARMVAPPGFVVYADMTQVFISESDVNDMPWVVRYRVVRPR
jgi:hypothetical protein